MLVLSDMHYQPGPVYKDVFHSIFRALEEELAAVWNKHPDWMPHCIVLAGDLASTDYAYKHSSVKCKKSEAPLEECYADIGTLLREITDILRQKKRFPCVVCTPGNHDKNIEASIDKDRFEKAIKSGDKSGDKSADISACEMLTPCFKEYAGFASGFHKSSSDFNEKKTLAESEGRPVHGIWNTVPYGWKGDEMGSVSGYMVFPAHKVCVVSFNSEVYYSGKAVTALSEGLVENMETVLAPLKSRGFSVVTVMHRSPYKLDWASVYRITHDGRSLVDKMVDMSDMIICGHDHRPERRSPDILEGRTPLVQNGYIFDQKDYVCRDPADRDVLYSVSLLQYNPSARVLRSRELKCSEQNYGESFKHIWKDQGVKTYYLESLQSPRHNETESDRDGEFVYVTVSSAGQEDALIRERLLAGRKDDDCKVIIVDIDTMDETKVESLSRQIKEESRYVYLALTSRIAGDKSGQDRIYNRMREAKTALRETFSRSGLLRKAALVMVVTV